MRSKGTDTGETLEGDPPEDESGVSSSVPSGGVSHWAPPIPTPHASASNMLYINMEEPYPQSPPLLERDPNMSSAARYSPLHGAPAAAPYPACPQQLARALSSLCYSGQPAEDAAHYMPAAQLHTERLAPLLHSIEDVTCSDEAVQHDSSPGFYSQQGYATGDGYGVSSSSAVYLPPTPSTDVTPSHLIDTTADVQLVMSSDGEYHMIAGSGMKAEQVELLITGGQSGVSYALSSENGFIVARPTVTNCTSNKQADTIENTSMTVDVSVLDSLDEATQFDGDQSIVLESETLSEDTLHLDIGNSDELVSIDVLTQSPGDGVSSDYSTEMEAFDIVEYVENDGCNSSSRRGRKLPQETDMSIMCIPDKSVPCRARASLPAAHLWLGPTGVLARRRIPARARFGPLEGRRRRLGTLPPDPAFLLHTVSGDFAVDVSDEKTSNWMRYVRFAPGPSQNVCVQQCGEALYFTSCRPIPPRGELLLGYGTAYARRWGLPMSYAADDEEQGLEWPCYECPMRFASSPELQAHLNMHDDTETKPTLTRKGKKKSNKIGAITEHRCSICSRIFPRGFSLKRHMRTHSQQAQLNSIENITDKDEVQDVDMHYPQKEVKEKKKDEISQQNIVSSSIKQENFNINPEEAQSPATVHTPPIKNEPSPEQDVWTSIENSSSASECDDSLPFGPAADTLSTTSEKTTPPEGASSEKTQGHSCRVCRADFPTGEFLNIHKEEHTNSDTRVKLCNPQVQQHSDSCTCPFCNKAFVDYNCLRNHMRSFHSVRRYACLDCGTNYCSSDKLRLHMLKHSEHREFLCPECGKQFKRKDKLNTHLRRIHCSRSAQDGAEVIVPKCHKPNPVRHSSAAEPDAYLRFTFKCTPCRLGFKRRGMLVNHLARRHPEVSRATVPELQLPILRAARDYFCQHCDKVYKSSSKRKAHILKNHPGESLPPPSRGAAGATAIAGIKGYSACVGAVPSAPQHCPHGPCHKQYASKAKLLQHIRHKHPPQMPKLSKFSDISNDTKHRITDSSILKSKLTSSPPPLQPVSSFNKNDDTAFVGLLDGLLSGDPRSPAIRRKSPSAISSCPTEDITELPMETKPGGFLAPRIGWKTDDDPAALLECLRSGGARLRLVQISESSPKQMERSLGALPPVSVLAGPRYTDR